MEKSEFIETEEGDKKVFLNFDEYVMEYGKDAIFRALSNNNNLEEIIQELINSNEDDD